MSSGSNLSIKINLSAIVKCSIYANTLQGLLRNNKQVHSCIYNYMFTVKSSSLYQNVPFYQKRKLGEL